MLAFMGENKRLLNIHELKFVELAAFHWNLALYDGTHQVCQKGLLFHIQPSLYSAQVLKKLSIGWNFFNHS